MSEIITVFCPFSREWAVEQWIENFKAVEHDPALTNLCFIIDGDQSLILNRLRKLGVNYRSLHTRMNEYWHPNEVKLAVRRQRVAELHNQSKELIAKTDGDIIIGLEDDTYLDRLQSFEHLYRHLDEPLIGFVEGVQMGRWGANIIGAWQVNDLDSPTDARTCLPSDGVELISAGGFYGYATRRALYLNHEYHSSSSEPYGPDVNYGLYVRRQGFKCLIDWNIVFGHRDHNAIAYPEQYQLAQVIFSKDTLTGKWSRIDNEPNRY